MRFKATRASGGPARYRLPLIALIDVVLFLLLYFIVAGNLADEEAELAASLRAQQGGGAAVDLQPQIVAVTAGADGAAEFRIGERVVRDKASLTEVLRVLPKEGGVFVRVSRGVAVDAVAAALQACQDAGFVRVTYVPAG